jgi:phage terminase large subunit
MERELELPAKLGFLFKPARYKVAYGGRGGAKSWGFARALLVLAAQRRRRILCARELQTSIQESVHRLLSEQVDALGLAAHYDVQKASIIGRNGSEFIFSGIRHNVTKIKSMEGIDVCWVEEAETISEESWQVLIPTIRKPGSEIWVSFNPREETDPTYARFVKQPPPDARVVEISWRDNPWLPDELLREKDYLYRVDVEAAEHVWGGKTRHMSNAQVLRGRWRVEAFEPHACWCGPYYGADWGFAQDPSTLVKVWVDGRTLYVEHEAYGIGIEIDRTPELFDAVPGAREHTIRADSARPETISYMQRHGYDRVEAAAKGSGSVEDGVEHLRSYEAVVIHPRCRHAAEEARLWSYKVDRLTGDVLPDLVDKHNHCWDAIRYALEPISRGTPGAGLVEYMRQQAEARSKSGAASSTVLR